MPLKLVLGPANSAKAGEVLGAYASASQRGALLVVPTAPDAAHYAREQARAGAVLGSVLTFGGLAAEVARRAGYGGRRLSALQRDRVLRRAVSRVRFRALNSAAQAPGFATAAGNLIAELERTLVTPQRFAAAMRTWAAEDDRRRGYAEDVASIYLAYGRELEAIGRVDSELYAWQALDALRLAPGAWGDDPVFFYGFDDLHRLERDAVETLARVVGVQVTVSLTYEPGRAALGARAEVVEELRPLAAEVLELQARDEHYDDASRAALHHLERYLFEPSPSRVDPGRAVRLLEAGGERAEAELVAAEVLELLRAGIAGDEIAVVYRSPAGGAPAIERVFEQYGIAIALDRQVPFGHTALGRGLLALARCALLRDRARAEDLLDYLRSPGLLERPEIADGLEADLRQQGLRTAAQARDRLGWTLGEIDALADAEDAAAELARQGRRLFAAPHRGSAPVVDQAAQLDAHALSTMLRALSELDDLGERLPAVELIELLEGLTVPDRAPARSGAVLVSDPLAIRARRFTAVFVCGLQEGGFPLATAPEPFLSDERRRELAACSGLRLAPSDAALARERYLFYACTSRATREVVLSYRSSDEEGNLALASPFIADVAELMDPDWPQRRRRRMLADVVWPADQAPTARELARTEAAATAPLSGDVPSPLHSLSDSALRHVRHSEILSGGALEAYGDCPVKWLVERELQPARFEPDPDPIVRGSYMHEVLEEVIKRLDGAVTPQSLPDALGHLEDVLEESLPPIAAGRSEGVRAAALRAIEADLRRYLRHEAGDDSDWEPRAVELRFGFEGDEDSLPALELGQRPGTVRVRGAIDRVDVDPDGRRAIVRDYKSGSARPDYQGARWQSERRLQVALYMLAVRDLLGLEPVAGLYQPLTGGDLRARGVYLGDADVGSRLFTNDARDEEQLREVLEDTTARAIALASRLRAGELTPCPQSCSRDGCRYPGICRSQ
ncbi:MAG: PD-(D/E)XK nuclease family protein [Solirubrobacteraceae bacterium]